MVMTIEAGSDETHETGTTTTDVHVDGTTTVAGTKTNEVVATVTTADDGTEAITEVGTDSGTLVHETMATDGDEATTMT